MTKSYRGEIRIRMAVPGKRVYVNRIDTPLRRVRLTCAECGWAWLRPGAAHYAFVATARWAMGVRWTCRDRQDCWRRQRHHVAHGNAPRVPVSPFGGTT